MNLSFKQLNGLEERLGVFPLYRQLNAYLTYEKFCIRMEDLMQEPNYYLLSIWDDEKLIAISGYWISHKLYCGKYLEPDNVVVDENHRSKGIGEILQLELERIALENECNVMMLDAYLDNTAGHRFYEKYGYQKKGYHFVKKWSNS